MYQVSIPFQPTHPIANSQDPPHLILLCKVEREQVLAQVAGRHPLVGERKIKYSRNQNPHKLHSSSIYQERPSVHKVVLYSPQPPWSHQACITTHAVYHFDCIPSFSKSKAQRSSIMQIFWG